MTTEQDYPILVAQNGPLKGLRWSINQTVVVGRDANCDVVVPDRQVSRYHVRLTPGPSGVILEDLGSKNGTQHNGNVLTGAVVLQDGDMIQVAVAQEFMFLTSDATMPLDGPAPQRTGRLVLDMRSRQVWVNQRLLSPSLSAQQFELLWRLYQAPGEVVRRQELIAAVWGEEQSAGVTDQALDALIRRLRDRLAEMDPTHAYIVTLRGHGMRLENPASE